MADVLASVGASAALMTSTVPWRGPIASVRVGMIDGSFVINPTREDQLKSNMELIVSGNKETIVMVEGEATEASEETILEALRSAHRTIQEIIELQIDLINDIQIKKDEFELPKPNSELINDIEEKIGDEIINIVSITEKNKRNEEKANLITNTIDGLLEKYPDEESNIKNLIEDKFKNQFRKLSYQLEKEAMAEIRI